MSRYGRITGGTEGSSMARLAIDVTFSSTSRNWRKASGPGHRGLHEIRACPPHEITSKNRQYPRRPVPHHPHRPVLARRVLAGQRHLPCSVLRRRAYAWAQRHTATVNGATGASKSATWKPSTLPAPPRAGCPRRPAAVVRPVSDVTCADWESTGRHSRSPAYSPTKPSWKRKAPAFRAVESLDRARRRHGGSVGRAV